VRLYSRPGNDLTRRFPLIVDALARLSSRSCIIDGEAVACDDNGVARLISSVTTALTAPCFYTPST
jgi:ATP-dependent DNA ligase